MRLLNFKEGLFFLVLFFTFFPYIGVIKNIDTQPNFIIFASIAFLLFFRDFKLNTKFLLVFILLTFCYFLSLIVGYEYLDLAYFITYFVVLLNLFFIYTFIRCGSLNITSKKLYIFMVIYIIVGGIQYYLPDFMSWAVTRSQQAALSFSETGRGVRSLSAEPATLGKLLNVFNVLFIILIHVEKIVPENKRARYGLAITVLLLLFNISIARSAYAVGIQLVFLYTYFFVFYKKSFFIITVSFLMSISIFVSYFFELQTYRIAQMFYIAFSEPSLLLEQGAVRRLFNIPISINNLNYFGYLGANNSPEKYLATLPTPFGPLDYLAHNRNLGGFVEWLLKFGILGIPMIILYSYFLISILRRYVIIGGKKYWLGLYFFVVTFLLTFQDGSPTAPFTWFTLLFLYFTLKKGFPKFL